ncbi:MAG: complex I NDUFA9 subunit family protein [Chloroflexi bacterium]|nr:complex I NDUFA9 subunit family protein [Chloroflexota bacterium]
MSFILITGASGFVASHVMPELIGAGHRIRALVRDAKGESIIRRRLEPARLDAVEFARTALDDADGLRRAVDGVDVVLHLIAIPRDWDGGKEMDRVNREGTRAVLDAAKAAGVRRFIHLGALGVRDDPALPYGRSKARANAHVRESGLDWTILSPSLLFGERDGFFNQIALLARLSPGVMPIPAGARSRFQPFWVGDLARVVRMVVDDPTTAGREFELGGPDQMTYREISMTTLRGMGKRRLLLPVPQAMIMFIARISEAVHLPFPVSSDQLRQLRFDNVTTPKDAVQQSFGFAPRRLAGSVDHLRRWVRHQEPDRTGRDSRAGSRR